MTGLPVERTTSWEGCDGIAGRTGDDDGQTGSDGRTVIPRSVATWGSNEMKNIKI